jgi:hypothetical protein
MMPPTIAMLRQLAPYDSAAEALRASARRDLSPVLAEARLEDGQVVLSWPGHDEFTKRVDVDSTRPAASASDSAGGGADSGMPDSAVADSATGDGSTA